MSHPAPSTFQILASPGFPHWLQAQQASLAFSTYQLGKLFFVGRKSADRLSVFERTFHRCLGLWTDGQTLWLAAAFQLWRLENMLSDGTLTEDGYDRLFVPQLAQTTGDVDAHDLGVDAEGRVLFVNTLFSCLATTSPRYSFEPVWKPPFIDRLAAEDRCHLNGLAMDNGAARYVTACSATNEHHGWRAQRDSGGCLIDVASGEMVVTGMSMPHSPRIYRDQLYVLNSGMGQFCRVDVALGRLEPIAFCPGYARGLAFHDRFAIIGLSRPRETTFAGLPLDQQLAEHRAVPQCGLMIVDLLTGNTVEWMKVEGRVDELYDVLVLPGVTRAKAFGLKNDDLQRNVWFPDGDQVVRWTSESQ
jgi:uncharacterized protein (TIGR03032 family)